MCGGSSAQKISAHMLKRVSASSFVYAYNCIFKILWNVLTKIAMSQVKPDEQGGSEM